MAIPYRTRRFLRGLAIFAMILVLVLLLVWLVWLLWLDRHVVYTRDGAVLDFSRSDRDIQGQVALPPEDPLEVTIFYNEGDEKLDISTDLAQVAGYYIDAAMLETDLNTVKAQLGKLPPQTPVLIELKDIVGRFFYSTSLGPARGSISTTEVDSLIRYLCSSELYVIARISSLRDYYYGLDHVPDGLPLRGGYLYMDDDRCYWLNPSSSGTVTYLIQIITELKNLGFDEVVLGDFRFPDTDKVVFSGSRLEALSTTAQTLVDTCGDQRFAISFEVDDVGFQPPTGRTRVYMKDEAAAEAKSLASQVLVEDTAVELVFITDVNDTRFDDYGVLRPITSAQLDEE